MVMTGSNDYDSFKLLLLSCLLLSIVLLSTNPHCGCLPMLVINPNGYDHSKLLVKGLWLLLRSLQSRI